MLLSNSPKSLFCQPALDFLYYLILSLMAESVKEGQSDLSPCLSASIKSINILQSDLETWQLCFISVGKDELIYFLQGLQKLFVCGHRDPITPIIQDIGSFLLVPGVCVARLCRLFLWFFSCVFKSSSDPPFSICENC